MKKITELSLLMTDSPTKGAALALNRRSYGLTQAQAAALIHVSTATWQQYEQNRRRIHPAFMELWTIKVNILDKSG